LIKYLRKIILSKLKQNHQLHLILDAKHHDPFAFLGLHQEVDEKDKATGYVFRAFLPYATALSIETKNGWEDAKK